MDLTLGDSYYLNANSQARNIVLEEAFLTTASGGKFDFNFCFVYFFHFSLFFHKVHNAVLNTDGTYSEVDGDDTANLATVVCCGETYQQGCGRNPLSYDYNADAAVWDDVLLNDGENICNQIDTATGKPHVWKTLHAR